MRKSLPRKLIYCRHCDAVAVRILEALVHERLALCRQAVDVHLSSGDHHLPVLSVEFISVYIYIRELVVKTKLLKLAVNCVERTPVPQPDI